MSEPRRSGAGAAAAVVLLVVSGTALAGAVLLFLTAVGPGRSDPHGYSMIFSAIIGLVSAPVFLLALALVFGRRHPWVSLAVNIFLSLLSMGLGLLLVSSVVEAWSHTGRVGLTLLVPGCALLLLGAVIAGSSLLGAIRTWRRTRRQRRAGATDTGPGTRDPQRNLAFHAESCPPSLGSSPTAKSPGVVYEDRDPVIGRFRLLATLDNDEAAAAFRPVLGILETYTRQIDTVRV